MEKMKNKLIEKISSIYNQIDALDKELNSIQFSENVDRTDKFTVGNKVLFLQELNIKLFSTIDLFLELEGTTEELSKEIGNYYNTVNELRKPISPQDPEDVKKIKEFINNYKKNEV